MSKKVCVVIPVHRSRPSPDEIVSFKQCLKILTRVPIKVLHPSGLDMTTYRELAPSIEYVGIPQYWQSTLLSYNKLKLSNFFYELVSGYEYLLTYELDAFVFRDELSEWCNKGYDYIGAPWFRGYDKPGDEFLGVGNSGFSLRKVKTIKSVIKNVFYKEPSRYNTGRINRLVANVTAPYYYLRNRGKENFTIQQATAVQEDIVISQYLAGNEKFYLAPVKEAIRFSFEVNPSRLFKLNDLNLPFGCHGWRKYEFDFWKPFIEKEGYQLD